MPIVSKAPESAILLPINDFRQLVPLSRSALYGMIRRKELRTVQLGGRRFVPKTEADRLASGANQTPEAA